MSSEKAAVPKQVVLELCYAAVQKAATVHGSYDTHAMTTVAEALTEEIVACANDSRKKVEVHTDQVDTYQYLCAIFKELEHFIPLVRQFNVCLAVNRLGNPQGEF